ncbi:MAG: hypothetical protein ABIF77_04335, partial [bacterium]
MKKLVFSVLIILISGTVAVQAEYENGSVVGQVPDRVIVVLNSDIFPQVEKSADGVAVDIPSLNTLADRFEVRAMEQLHQGIGAPTKAGSPDLRLHWTVDFSTKYDLETVRLAYEALPEVAEAWAVDICKMHALPNDPALTGGQQWYLR